MNDVSCFSCHKLHKGPQQKVSRQEQQRMCEGCHQQIKMEFRQFSHHPVPEHRIACTDCHAPHNSTSSTNLRGMQVKAVCTRCHMEYQGPFVYEHADITEDCTNCHNPHGSPNDNLLEVSQPFLCLQCHESHFHTMRIGSTTASSALAFDANKLEGTTPTGTPTAANGIPFTNSNGADGWKMAFGTKCTVCHSVVHGSDLPSQTTPTIGANGQGFPDGGKATR
jgi:DmsE family decaheme c-type cytochrome